MALDWKVPAFALSALPLGCSGGNTIASPADTRVDFVAESGIDVALVETKPAGEVDVGPGDAGTGVGVDAGSPVDSVRGFSETQGANGWYYGYVQPKTDLTFRQMTVYDAEWKAWTVQRGTYWTLLRSDSAHGNGEITTGGTDSVEQWAVRRWVSTVDGPLKILVTLAKMNTDPSGNGGDGRVAVDGVVKWDRFVAAADTVGITESVSVNVKVGSTVDFVLDPHGSNDLADLAKFTATFVIP